MGIITYLNPNAINNNSISSSKIDGTVASKNYVDTQITEVGEGMTAMQEAFNSAYEALGTEINSLTEKTTALEVRATNAVKVTYTELKSLRDAGKLVAGTQYRITDYVTTTTQENTRSAGHQFDIIVTADDESTLNEEARAINHKFDNPDDDYFKDCNLSAWKIWYCLDNDSDRFAWAGIGELIGTIKPTTGSASGTYTYNSSISKIIFADRIYALKIGVRTQINPGPPVYITKTDDYTLVVEDEYGFVNGHLGISVYTVSQEDKGVIYRMIDEFNNDIPYDFKNIQFKHPNDTTTYPYYYYTFASDNVENNTDNSLSISNNCYSNTIKKFIYDYNKRKLNCIIFIGGMCYNNTFGNNCYSNTFGNLCFCNTFESYFQQNTFGNYCYDNSFGYVCCNNTFGNYCRENTFGHECRDNSFGYDCKNIKFASDSSSAATKYEYYQNNHFGDGCQYILFKGKETASNSQQVQNYNFAQGLKGTDSEYLTIDGVRGRSFETKVAKNSNGELKVYCEADLIL